MKITNVIRRFSFEEWGGTETVVWNTSKELEKRGNTIEILATQALCKVEEEQFNQIVIRRFPYFYPSIPLTDKDRADLDKKGGNPFSFKMLRHIKMSDSDIIHCHTMARLADTVRIAAQNLEIPYVISLHGGHFDVPEEEIEEMMKPLKHTFNYGKFIDVFMDNGKFLERADGIVCVGYNEYIRSRHKYPDKLVEYIPNGVNIDKFEKNPGIDFRTRHCIPEDAFVILCVSRIDYQKNQKLLIDMTEHLIHSGHKINLVLIGPVTAYNYYEKIKDRLNADERLGDAVTAIEGLPPDSDELVAAYQSADCFILPSLHEPFGIVALEAWASKLPVIASKVGGLEKLIKDGETGLFFDSDSLPGLLNAFEQLINNNELRERLVANAYEEVCKEYSWEQVTNKLYEFYQKVIKQYGIKNQ